MPNRDGTGPQGQGSKTGRRKGGCGGGTNNNILGRGLGNRGGGSGGLGGRSDGRRGSNTSNRGQGR